VAKGFEQQCGVDYTDTFRHVIKPSTIRIVFAMTVPFKWPIRQLDVSNAFIHGSFLEEIYMKQSQRFVNRIVMNLFVNFISPFMVLNKLLELGSIAFRFLC
jgi:hypothetical protein